MKVQALLLVATCGVLTATAQATDKAPNFDSSRDLLSLHYDHAPDRDDGHSAAADRTLLESLHGRDWIKQHVVAVSGAYGLNAKTFNDKSDAVMDACWKELGGWLDAHQEPRQAVADLAQRWAAVLEKGGDVWVKEGGQSDLTLKVLKRLAKQQPELELKRRIHVVQHSNWNENKTTPAALRDVKRMTHYIRIKDANAYLNQRGGNRAFEQAALNHPRFAPMWKAAFAYYAPSKRLDFSDTGELMHILDLGEMDIEAFRKRFLQSKPARPVP